MNIKKELKSFAYLEVASTIADEQSVNAFVVGGFVRDLILKREIDDIDIVVIGNGINFAKALAKKFNVNDVTIFKNFGTAHFMFNNINFEIVGARKESYKRESRKPEVETGSFEDDLLRRDFTINTMAVSLNADSFGEVIDNFNGLKDLEEKIIRTPRNPVQTFDDDPLRILRAFRFASQLNFTVVDDILGASEKLRDRLEIVSQERITDEFLKILSSQNPSNGLILLYERKVMEIIFPEIANLGGVEQRDEYHHKDVFYHTCEVVDNIAKKTDDIWLKFTALVHDIAKPQTKKFVDDVGWTFHGHEELGARMIKYIFKRMKLPMNKLSYVEKLVRLHLRPIALVNDDVTDSAIRRLIVAADDDLDDLITLCRADITSKNPEKVKKYLTNYEVIVKKVLEVKEKDKLRSFQSPVRGEDIMKVCNLKPSKKVGLIKQAIEDAILDGKIPNEYDAAYEYLLKIKDEFI